MSQIYDPKDRGFPEAFTAIDRAQIAMLRDLAASGTRLVVKGGMAMRAVVGSMRLTKDVDFDRFADVSTNSLRASLKRAMTVGAQSARLLGAQVDELKSTETTVRMRLSGTVSGQTVKFSVEVSGRRAPPEDCCETVIAVPPTRYGIAPFSLLAYTHDMLAASKVAAVSSPNRNVPRDIFDLNDLVAANPSGVLRAHFDHEALRNWRTDVLAKVSAITFSQASDELLPYIPPDIRERMTQASWEDMTLTVAGQVELWLDEALRPEQAAE